MIMQMDSHTTNLVGRIKQEAQRRVGAQGAAGLAPAGIAEALGIDPAEVRRHFPHRDDLLTALIMDAYNAMGDAAEQAARDSTQDGETPLGQWVATCRGIREWARAHPSAYALIWGPPLPDYSAPPETMIAGARAALVLIETVRQAGNAGGLAEERAEEPFSEGMRRNVETLAGGLLTGLPQPVIARLLVAWTQLLGMVSFAVYGHVQGFASDPDAFLDHAARSMGRYVGLLR